MKSPPLKRENMVFCPLCGKEVITKDLFTRLEGILEKRERGALKVLRLCPDCKQKEMLSNEEGPVAIIRE